MVDGLPDKPPQPEELEQMVSLFISKFLKTEKGSNANGEYIKYPSGELVCKGKFVVSPGYEVKKIQLIFPAQFIDDPAIELSGDVAKILSKSASSSNLELEIDLSNLQDDLKFTYQARGRWKD